MVCEACAQGAPEFGKATGWPGFLPRKDGKRLGIRTSVLNSVLASSTSLLDSEGVKETTAWVLESRCWYLCFVVQWMIVPS